LKKNYSRVIGIVLALIIITAVIWWQFNKKILVKNQITKAVAKGTDSIYYIHYDSSSINAIAGNATFFNVVLQSDSLQKKLYSNDTSGISKTIYNVHIERLSITGANVPSLLQKDKIQANSIEIYKPIITVTSTGKNEIQKFTAADSLALYEKITGKFKSIQAKEIKITDASIAFAKGKNSPHTNLQGVFINLQNFKIDSTRDYNNIISYFIKDVVAKIKTATVISQKTNQVYTLNDVEYNAPKRFIKVNTFLQTDTKRNKVISSIFNTSITGLSTNSFIYNRQIKADSLITNGGIIGIYKRLQKAGGTETIEIDNKFFDEAIVKNIRIGRSVLSVYDKANQNETPLMLKNVEFSAANIDSIHSRTDILKLLGKSNWYLKGDGFSLITKDKIYKVEVGPFELDKARKTIKINKASITPTLSEVAFVNSLKVQKDLYNVNFKNIQFSGADLTALFEKKSIIADEMVLEPVIKVFNDRTVMPGTESKMGKYPYQSMMKMPTKFFIKNVKVKNGYISYRERGAISKKIGDVFFSNVNGSIENVTNIDSYIKQKLMMQVDVEAKFLNMALLNSQWKMPMNATDGAFVITGKLAGFNGTKINPIIEPLGMGSIKSGNLKSFTFNIMGSDVKAEGDVVLLYDNLKIKLLKNSEKEIKNKNVSSFIANIIIKDQNPSNGKMRTGKIEFNRVMTKSFFNIVWKSLFDGFKKSLR